jgi:hypothetical protein
LLSLFSFYLLPCSMSLPLLLKLNCCRWSSLLLCRLCRRSCLVVVVVVVAVVCCCCNVCWRETYSLASQIEMLFSDAKSSDQTQKYDLNLNVSFQKSEDARTYQDQSEASTGWLARRKVQISREIFRFRNFGNPYCDWPRRILKL